MKILASNFSIYDHRAGRSETVFHFIRKVTVPASSHAYVPWLCINRHCKGPENSPVKWIGLLC